jgi:CheY-like chemotaxis protein
MLMNGSTPEGTAAGARTPGGASWSTTTQTIMIVNGSGAGLGLLETVLGAGRYDVVFVESTAHAYSQVKLVQPNLVILCTRLDEMDGFQVLSMLKLDKDTRGIPVLTYTTEYEGRDTGIDGMAMLDDDDEAVAPAPAGRMN